VLIIRRRNNIIIDVSFPRKREPMLSIRRRFSMDSRLRGNDNLLAI
jgi:hypothetical protein